MRVKPLSARLSEAALDRAAACDARHRRLYLEFAATPRWRWLRRLRIRAAARAERDEAMAHIRESEMWEL